MPDNQISIRIRGNKYQGWSAFGVTRSLEQISGSFELTAHNLPDFWDKFSLSDPVTVEIDGHIALEGYINAVSPQYDASGSSLKVVGRDAVGDLLDCAASVDDGFEFNNQSLVNILRTILRSYDIPLTVAVSGINKPITRLAVQPGETAFDLIERACRLRAVLAVSDGVGGLVLMRAGAVKSAGRLVYGQNIIKGESTIDWSERFSLYVVKGQSEALLSSSAEEQSQPEGRIIDPSITRYRPRVILAESQGNNASLKERAKWQRDFDQSRSKRATYTVQGYFAAEGELWRPNQIVSVVDPLLKIKRDMLIVSVFFQKSEQGSTTNLTLAVPESFDLPAEKEPAAQDIMGAL